MSLFSVWLESLILHSITAVPKCFPSSVLVTNVLYTVPGLGVPDGFFVFLFFILFNVYLFSREREQVSRGGAEREGDTESKTGSRL